MWIFSFSLPFFKVERHVTSPSLHPPFPCSVARLTTCQLHNPIGVGEKNQDQEMFLGNRTKQFGCITRCYSLQCCIRQLVVAQWFAWPLNVQWLKVLDSSTCIVAYGFFLCCFFRNYFLFINTSFSFIGVFVLPMVFFKIEYEASFACEAILSTWIYATLDPEFYQWLT